MPVHAFEVKTHPIHSGCQAASWAKPPQTELILILPFTARHSLEYLPSVYLESLPHKRLFSISDRVAKIRIEQQHFLVLSVCLLINVARNPFTHVGALCYKELAHSFQKVQNRTERHNTQM